MDNEENMQNLDVEDLDKVTGGDMFHHFLNDSYMFEHGMKVCNCLDDYECLYCRQKKKDRFACSKPVSEDIVTSKTKKD